MTRDAKFKGEENLALSSAFFRLSIFSHVDLETHLILFLLISDEL